MPTISSLLWSVLTIALFASVHPFVSYPLSLLLMQRVRRRDPVRPPGHGQPPSPLSICAHVCAHNEEDALPRQLDVLSKLERDHPNFRFKIYSDASCDGTNAILSSRLAKRQYILGGIRCGKSHGLNVLREHCRSDIILLLDANVFVDEGVILAIEEEFAEPNVGLVCGTVRRLPRTSGGGVAASQATSYAYYGLETKLKLLESAVESTVMSDGSLFAVRSDLCPYIPPSLMDDAYVSLKVFSSGYRLKQSRLLRGFEYDDAAFYQSLVRRRRIACQAFRCHLHLWGSLRRLSALRLYMYLSHKFMRWFVGVSLVLAISCASVLLYINVGLREFWIIICSMSLVSILLLVTKGRYVASVLGSLLYTSFGLWDALRGRSAIPWTPVRRRRP